MRYIEVRFVFIVMEMLRDIEKDIVNMIFNYFDSEMEFRVLFSRYLNFLVNGIFGIVVGFVINILLYNLNEVIDGVLVYIDNNEIIILEFMSYIKGLDLFIGGIFIG